MNSVESADFERYIKRLPVWGPLASRELVLQFATGQPPKALRVITTGRLLSLSSAHASMPGNAPQFCHLTCFARDPALSLLTN